jgi:hypothetical protein
MSRSLLVVMFEVRFEVKGGRRCGFIIKMIKDNETKIVRYSLTLYVNTRVSPFFARG